MPHRLLTSTNAQRGLLAILILVFIYVVFRTAWLCDDAYITFRVVDNLLSGYGPVWNPTERVQPYTHPLWFWLLSVFSGVVGSPYYGAYALSILLSVIVVVFVSLDHSRTLSQRLVLIATLILSKAFVDYGTSGLENPASYLLVTLFVYLFVGARSDDSPARITALVATAALAVLNRMDLILIFVPGILVLLYRFPSWRRIGPFLLAATPLLVWELFSLIYYGSFVPNTAYAKLGTGVGALTRILYGGKYFYSCLISDPTTSTFAAISVTAALVRKDWKTRSIAAGALLYLLYLIWIGGDFMKGRLITVPFLAAVLAASYTLNSRWKLTGAVVALATCAILTPRPNLFSGSSYGTGDGREIDRFGVADERGVYYRFTGLLRSTHNTSPDHIEHEWALEGRTLRDNAESSPHLAINIGFLGYFAGPSVHVIDRMGLADPLLSRLAVRRGRWRPGHILRSVPRGYVESVRKGENLIEDEQIRVLYDKVRVLTQGELLSARRFATALRLSFTSGEH